MQVRRSPAFGLTLRTNYGSGLSVFLATCLRGGVPAKMANHRVGGQRVGSRLTVIPETIQSESEFHWIYPGWRGSGRRPSLVICNGISFTSKAVWPEKRQNGLGDLRFSKAAHLETGEPLVIAD